MAKIVLIAIYYSVLFFVRQLCGITHYSIETQRTGLSCRDIGRGWPGCIFIIPKCLVCTVIEVEKEQCTIIQQSNTLLKQLCLGNYLNPDHCYQLAGQLLFKPCNIRKRTGIGMMPIQDLLAQIFCVGYRARKAGEYEINWEGSCSRT